MVQVLQAVQEGVLKAGVVVEQVQAEMVAAGVVLH